MALTSLVIQTSFLGDMVLTTPLLSELAARGPVDVVATPASAGLLANHPGVREVIVYDKRGVARGMTGLLRLARTLRARRYGAAFLAQGSMRSAALARLAGARERIGFTTSAGRALYTTRVTYRDDRHHAERLWRLAAGDAAPSPPEERVRPRLYPGHAERAAVDALLADGGYRGGPLWVLAPGSVWPTKAWPYYDALAERLVTSGFIVVIGGAGEAALAERVVAAADRAAGAGRAVSAAGRLSLLASAELMARATAAIVNDSLPQHLASAAGTPTVAVFGPTVPEFGFGPLAPRRRVLGHEGLACRPCDRHGPRRCPLGHWRCMREIDAATVAEAARAVTSTFSQ